MTENTMFADLLAAQKEMPNLQKSGINPHFNSRFIPLDELISKILPVLNAHNLVLIQQPTTLDGQPALTTRLLHVSGEEISSTMLLLCGGSPQDQGSGLTYAKRYAALSTLGLTADVDDDAETTRKNGQQPAQRPAGGQQKPTPPTYDGQQVPPPACPEHNVPCKLVPGGTSKASGKPYSSFFACPQKGCGQNGKSWTIFADKWSTDWMMEHNREPAMQSAEFDASLPFE